MNSILPPSTWDGSTAMLYRGREDDDRPLIVAFSSLGVDRADKPFEFRGLLKREDCAVLLVRDLATSWYHLTPGLGQGPNSLVDAIAARTRGHRRVVTVGFSMGGYAALLVGRTIGADAIIALAPQTSISPQQLMPWGDRRWEQALGRVYRSGDRRMLDLEPLFRDTRHLLATQAITLCTSGVGDAFDERHAAHLERFAKVHRVGVDPLSHGALVVALRESGLLRTMIDAGLSGAPPLASVAEHWSAWMERSRYAVRLDPGRLTIDGRLLHIAGVVTLGTDAALACDAVPGHPVRVGARLWSETKPGVHGRETRFDFPVRDLRPGSEHPFALEISVAGLEPGEHRLTAALVREGRYWFDDFGFAAASVTLRVGPSGICSIVEGTPS